MPNREKFQKRSFQSNLKIRNETEATDEKVIEGFFAVTNSKTELWEGCHELIAPGAFKNSIENNDIRALINHETKSVLGRNKAGTLTLEERDGGLYGKVIINQNDTEAVNLYHRVQRGDVSQCSIGFNVIAEDYEYDSARDVTTWTVTEIDLHEVSVVTFPAYEDTTIEARQKQMKNIKRETIEVKREKLKERLNNVKTFKA